MYTKTHFYSKTADHINAAARMEWNYWKNNKKKLLRSQEIIMWKIINVKEGLCCFICLQHTPKRASEIYSQYIAFLCFIFNKINKKNFSFFLHSRKKKQNKNLLFTMCLLLSVSRRHVWLPFSFSPNSWHFSTTQQVKVTISFIFRLFLLIWLLRLKLKLIHIFHFLLNSFIPVLLSSKKYLFYIS